MHGANASLRRGLGAVGLAVVAVVSVLVMGGREALAVRAPLVVLDVRRTGGFSRAFNDFRGVPEHLITDKLHYRPGPVPASYPGPMIGPVLVSTVTSSTGRRIDKLAKSAGLARPSNDWGLPPTADVPDLRLTYRGRVQSIASWGVGESALTQPQQAARRKVAALLASLPTTSATVFAPTKVVLAVRLADPSADQPGVPAPDVKDWPASAEDISSSGGCLIITSSAGITLLQTSNADTQFRRSAKTWQVFARPMLPGDPGCGQQA